MGRRIGETAQTSVCKGQCAGRTLSLSWFPKPRPLSARFLPFLLPPGNPWTADYLKITGELDVDLRSNIAAEARAKIVYERLIGFTNDASTKEALQFLMTREITHLRAFMQALESLGKHPLSIGEIPPTPGVVDQYYNDSTGEGDDGETDAEGPWNTGEGIEVIDSPALAGFQVLKATPKTARTTVNGEGNQSRKVKKARK